MECFTEHLPGQLLDEGGQAQARAVILDVLERGLFDGVARRQGAMELVDAERAELCGVHSRLRKWGAGSRTHPRWRHSKCRWGAQAKPVSPTRAMGCPRLTNSPAATRVSTQCA